MRRVTRYPVEGPNALHQMYRTVSFFKVVKNFAVIQVSRYTPWIPVKNWMYKALLGMRIGKYSAFALMAMPDILYPEKISIGRNTIIGYNTTILTHEYLTHEYRIGDVVIGNDVMIGANTDEIAPIRPLIETIGTTIHFMGRRGGGSAIKIINNFMSFAIMIVNAEALLMADHIGIPFDNFYDVVSSSSGGNVNLNAKKDKIRANDIEASFTTDLVIKDMELAVQLCRDSGISNFTLNSALQWYRMAQYQGYAKKDSSSVVQLIRNLQAPH